MRQGGGAIGSGQLSAFGASPWQFGLALGGALGAVGAGAIGVLAALARWQARVDAEASWLAAVPSSSADDREDGDEADALAG